MAATATAARTRRSTSASRKSGARSSIEPLKLPGRTVLSSFWTRYFQLDTDAFAKFNAALDASPAENPRLRELLSRKAPWER